MQPDETDEERLEQLPEDSHTPFTPSDPNGAGDDTAPQTDTDVDTTELYQQSVDSPEGNDPGIAGYNPDKDQRQ